MIRTVIIDDELDAREQLKFLLDLNCPNVKIVGEAFDVKSGFEIIERIDPELVLLDIHLPDGTGFELLNLFSMVNFGVIFTTAFSEFAIEAFKFSAIHYLLKPIDPDDLIAAVEKAGNKLNKQNLEDSLKSLYFNLQNSANRSKRIVLTTNANWYVVNSDEIVLCSADKNYTEFYISDGRKITVSKTLKDFEDLLLPYGFFRAHKQYLININHIKSFDRSGAGMLYMTQNHEVPVSPGKKDQLIKLLTNL